jgi:hypothetical protein
MVALATHQVDEQPTFYERGRILLISSIPSEDCINFNLQFICLVNEFDLFSSCWIIVHVESNNPSF